jgi:hypothetical protein
LFNNTLFYFYLWFYRVYWPTFSNTYCNYKDSIIRIVSSCNEREKDRVEIPSRAVNQNGVENYDSDQLVFYQARERPHARSDSTPCASTKRIDQNRIIGERRTPAYPQVDQVWFSMS